MENRILEKEYWRTWDTLQNIQFPWYTRTFLKELIKWDIKNWNVFEYGAGDSTEWWKKNVRSVYAADTNEYWADKTQSFFTSDKQQFIEYPKQLINNSKELFDCIIIDSDPTEWRDECAEIALQCIKNNGIIIIDNYEQETVNLKEWPLTNKLFSSYEKHVFKEPEHVDWKTAYWIIKK